MVTGIYKITNPKKLSYIGQSVNIHKRFKSYKKLRCKGQPKIYYSLLKYGVENHSFEILEECNIEQLSEREVYWGEKFNSIENGLNLSLGYGPVIRSKEHGENISKAKKGCTPWNKGLKGVQKHTQETKDKMSENKKGFKHSDDAKEAISKKHKASGNRPPSRKGTTWSEERRRKFNKTLSDKKLHNRI